MGHTPEQRQYQRFPVEFNSYFATPKAVEGLGVVTDISEGGCRITSTTRGWPGTALRLRISSVEKNLHIQVAEAQVRWARGGQFGVEFKEISDEDTRHLRQAINEVQNAPKV